MVSQCLRGEMRVPKASTASNLASAGILARLTNALNLKGDEEVKVRPLRNLLITSIALTRLLRLMGLVGVVLKLREVAKYHDRRP